MTKYQKNHKDVEFFAPGRKSRVCGSTQATSDFLSIVHYEHPEYTILQLKDLIADRTQFIPNPEAISVLDSYIKLGYENYVPKWRY